MKTHSSPRKLSRFFVRKFADATSISEALAKKILDALYAKDLTANDLSSVLWKIQDSLVREKLWEYADDLSDEEIDEKIDEIIAERKKWEDQVSSGLSGSEPSSIFDLVGSKMPKTAWLFSEFTAGKDLKEGDTVTIQIMRVGTWDHPSYGEVKITKSDIAEFVANFEENVREIDIAVDENHEDNHRALGWYQKLYTDATGENLFADIEVTKKGADLLNEGAYRYFSPEIAFEYEDPETGNEYSNLLLGGAFTNRPFFKGMQPLMASEVAAEGKRKRHPEGGQFSALFFTNSTMKGFLTLMQKLADKDVLTKSERDELQTKFSELPKEDQNAKMKAAVDEVCARFEEEKVEEKKPAKKGKKAPKVEAKDEETDEEDADGEDDEDEEDKHIAALQKIQEKHKEKTKAKSDAIDELSDEMDEELEADEEEACEPKMTEILAKHGIKMNEDGSFNATKDFAESMSKIMAEQQKRLSQAQRELRFSESVKTYKKLLFSEKNPNGMLLPKDVKVCSEFACSLSVEQAKKFHDIVSNLRLAKIALKRFGENGDGDSEVADGEKKEPTDQEVKASEEFGFYVSKLHFSEAEALSATKKVFAERAKQK